MDLDLLTKVVGELNAVLAGARVDRVVPAADHGLYLVLHRRNANPVLLLSPDRSLPRIHLVGRRPAGNGTPAGFALSLRKHLTGSRLLHVGLVNNDRVVELGFSRDGMTHALIFELTGAGSNLLLTDGARTILSVLRPSPPGDGARRALIPGLAYVPPERPKQARSRSGPVLREMPGEGDEGSTPCNRAAEAWYEKTIAERQVASLRTQLASTIRRSSARTERRRAAVASDIAAAEQGDDLRAAGELLLANKHLIAKGRERAELAGFDGTPVTIALDPALTPLENAERYFRRYKKAKAGLALLRERYTETLSEAAFLDAAREDLTAAEGREDLLAVRSLLVRRGHIRDPAGKAAGPAGAAPPYRVIEHQGWQIVIGKSAAGNDHITTKLARPDDLWLHAEGMPGSHVLVRNPGKRDVPDDVLRKAASLAAFYSKGRNSSKVPVAYTSAKFVRKPKGAAPGTVTLAERRTMMAVPAPE